MAISNEDLAKILDDFKMDTTKQFANVNDRFIPLESIAASLHEIVKMGKALAKASRWAVALIGSGALIEVGKLIVDGKIRL